MKILDVEDAVDQCQLISRSWTINNEGEEEEHVQGEGVIGQYPILTRGGAEFQYESCTYISTRGSMHGHFTFVIGTIAQPRTPKTHFDAIVPTFHMSLPRFVY